MSIKQRMTENQSLSTEEKRKRIVEALKEKKAKQILAIDLRKIDNAFCDHFIICHGESTTQVRALSDIVETRLKEHKKTRVHHIEGLKNCHWVLMDYHDILVHIFIDDQRKFYSLEELWADGEIEKFEDEL